MRALLFLIRKNLKNIIKLAFKRPMALIGYIIALIFLVLMIVAAFAMPSGLGRTCRLHLVLSAYQHGYLFLDLGQKGKKDADEAYF